MFAHELETFMVTAKAGSFQKASEQLYISSTALIKQINALEGKTGLILFHRTNRGLSLTEAGKIFQSAAADILQRYYDALRSAKQMNQMHSNPIRIGVSLINPFHRGADSMYYTPGGFTDFTAYILPIGSEYKDFVDEVRNIGVNVDLIPYFCGNTDLSAYCRSFCLARLPLRVAVPITHSLANRELLTYEDLNNQSIVTIHSGSNEYYKSFNEDILTRAPLARLHSVTYIDFRILNHAAIYGQLVLVGNYLKDVHPLLRLIPVDWNHYLPYGLLYSRTPSETVSAFLQTYREIGISGEAEDAIVVDL